MNEASPLEATCYHAARGFLDHLLAELPDRDRVDGELVTVLGPPETRLLDPQRLGETPPHRVRLGGRSREGPPLHPAQLGSPARPPPPTRRPHRGKAAAPSHEAQDLPLRSAQGAHGRLHPPRREHDARQPGMFEPLSQRRVRVRRRQGKGRRAEPTASSGRR